MRHFSIYNDRLSLVTCLSRFLLYLLIIILIIILILYFAYDDSNQIEIQTKDLQTKSSNIQEIKNNIIFRMQPENYTILSHIRAADRKKFITNVILDKSKLSTHYQFNASSTNIEKLLILSKCLNIYPFNEFEEILVKQSNYQQISLKTPFGNTPIALHNAGDAHSDWYRSNTDFEPGLKEGIVSYLNTDPQLALLDVGAMLGFYTLHAALKGHFVISVEANIENARRLSKSLVLGRLEHRALLLQNAIWEENCKVVEFGSPSNTEFSIGMISAASTHREIQSQSQVLTITLNDILKLLLFSNIKRAIMKIDIEGSEYEALQSANLLFDNIDIPIIFMEWLFFSPDFDRPVKDFKIKGEFIKDFFYSRRYKAYPDAFSKISLNRNDVWPGAIVFKR